MVQFAYVDWAAVAQSIPHREPALIVAHRPFSRNERERIAQSVAYLAMNRSSSPEDVAEILGMQNVPQEGVEWKRLVSLAAEAGDEIKLQSI